MTTDLREQLQATLGDTYTLERELGGGGMSRVFLAEETALGRRVVVKVLAPELTEGMSAERFAREVRVAARLQHPNVVPLLVAGERDGLAYYTMPYVEGESLRARLTHGGPLPVAAAISVLRDVARALEYAHAHGVVHRDVKPDNVLLAGSAAAVADFGIAKALHLARTAGAAGAANTAGGAGAPLETLTRIGASLGTPAYMAPEQAAGDPDVDARADLYAWGGLAYELLSGAPPFAGRPVHQLIAAHMAERPPSLGARAPNVPPGIEALVMQCLEKNPARRPQSATDVLRVLDAVITPAAGAAAGGRRSRLRRVAARWPVRIAALAALIAIVAGSITASLRARRAVPVAGPRRVAVAPFTNGTGTTGLDPLGAMVADWITQGLAKTGLVDVVPTGESLFAHQQARARAAAGGSSLLGTFANETKAQIVVSGAYYRDGDSLRFQAQVTDGVTGRVLRVVEGMAVPEQRPLQGVEGLRQRVMGALAVTTDVRLSTDASVVSQPSDYRAYQELIAGLERFARAEWKLAIPHLYAAAADSAFTSPLAYAAIAHINLGDPAAADSLAHVLAGSRERLPPLDRFMLEWLEAQLRGDRMGAYEAARQAQGITSGSLFAFQAGYEAMKLARAREAISRLERLDPERGWLRTWPSYWTRLAGALHVLGEHRRELLEVERARALQPDEPSHRLAEVQALAALGRIDEVDARVHAVSEMYGATSTPGDVMLAAAQELRAHGHVAASERTLRGLLAWDRTLASAQRGSVGQRWLVARALAESGEYARAAPLLARLAADDPDELDYRGYATLIAMARGDRAAAGSGDAWLASRHEPYRWGEPALWRARVAAFAGQRERAVALLREAFAQGTPFSANLHTDWGLAPLRGYASYEALLRPKE